MKKIETQVNYVWDEAEITDEQNKIIKPTQLSGFYSSGPSWA